MLIKICYIPHLPDSYYTKTAFETAVNNGLIYSFNTNHLDKHFKDGLVRGEFPNKIVAPTSRGSLGVICPNFLIIGDRICRIESIDYLNTTSCTINYTSADDYNDLHNIQNLHVYCNCSFQIGGNDTNMCQVESGPASKCDRMAFLAGGNMEHTRTQSYNLVNDLFSEGVNEWRIELPPRNDMFGLGSVPGTVELNSGRVFGYIARSTFSELIALLSDIIAQTAFDINSIDAVYYVPNFTQKYRYSTFKLKKRGVTASVSKNIKFTFDINGDSPVSIPYIGNYDENSDLTQATIIHYMNYSGHKGLARISVRAGWTFGTGSEIETNDIPFIGAWDINTSVKISANDVLQTVTNIGNGAISAGTTIASAMTGNVAGVVTGVGGMAKSVQNTSVSFGNASSSINKLPIFQGISSGDLAVQAKAGVGNKTNITCEYLHPCDQYSEYNRAINSGIDHPPIHIDFNPNIFSGSRLCFKGDANVENSVLRNQIRSGIRIYNAPMNENPEQIYSVMHPVFTEIE